MQKFSEPIPSRGLRPSAGRVSSDVVESSVNRDEAKARVCVVGLGYVGLPLATLMASSGMTVIGVDIVERVVDSINRGRVHIAEGGLDELLSDAVNAGRLRASSVPVDAEVFVITVPTPVKDDLSPDLRCVEAAIDSITPFLRRGSLVLLESTCPSFTTECMRDRMAAARRDLHFGGQGEPRLDQVSVAYCPERVLPGNALNELVGNDRVVGGLDELSTSRAADFYSTFIKGRIVRTTARTAEMCKLAENTFRDINIAYANELARICGEVGVCPFELIGIANLHPRVDILQPGPGVGGHCIAVDPWFLVHTAPETARLIRTAREINDAQPNYVVSEILNACDAVENSESRVSSGRPVVACFGLSYKPDVDDFRESPAVEVVSVLASSGRAQVLVVEPFITSLPASLGAAGVELVDVDDAMQRAEVMALLVHHKEFLRVGEDLHPTRRVIDTRGVWRRGADLA